MIILIGGGPCTGKSFLATALSRRLGLPWISSDTLCEVMRQLVRPEDYPALRRGALRAEEYLSGRSLEQIIAEQLAQDLEVWKAVQALIETDYSWRSFIVEGVGVVPEKVQECYAGRSDVKSVFLYDGDERRIRKVVYARGLWGDADTYSDAVKPIEVAWARLYGQQVRDSALRVGLPVLEVRQRRTMVRDCCQLLGLDRTKRAFWASGRVW